VHFVSGANLQLIDDAENIEQHDGQFIDAAQRCRIANGDGVEPAATAWTASHRAVFSTALADTFADAGGAVIKLRRKWTAAYTGGVGFDDADDPRQVAGGYPRARPNPRCGAIGAGHEGIGAMIDIKQAALGGFEKKSLVRPQRLV